MREILFRGAQKVDCTKSLIWYEGSLIIETDGYTGEKEYYIQNENGSYLVIPKTIGQYTGLTDKNGKKIFEGDILKDNTLPITCGVGVIEFGNYKTKTNSSLINDNYSYHIGFYITWDDTLDFREDLAFWNEKIEIIGNIHDNPELLKEVH